MVSSFQLDAIGTRWEIETQEPLEAALRRRILARIEEFDRTYSRFRPDSLVSRVAAAPDGGAFEFPADSTALFALYDRLHGITDGAVDPLVGRDLELLGYDAAYTLTPAPAELRSGRRGRWSDATVPESLRLQRLFAAAVPRVVVGKRIDDVHVGRLAGSSGTPKGFNDAVRRIRKQARRQG